MAKHNSRAAALLDDSSSRSIVSNGRRSDDRRRMPRRSPPPRTRHAHCRHTTARPPPKPASASLLCLAMRDICTTIQRKESLSDSTKGEIRTVMKQWRLHHPWTREEAYLAVDVLKTMELAGEELEMHDFTSVINAFAKVPACSQAAENILWYMEESERPELRPDRVTINTVIGALAKSGEKKAAEQAERLLRRLEKDYSAGDKTRKPNAKSYGKVVEAYAKSKQPDRASEMLRHLEEQFRNGNTDDLLSVHMYTFIIDGYAKSGRRDSAEKAERILHSLLQLFDQFGTPYLRPDAIVFSAVVNAWSKSKQPNRADRVLMLLEDMKHFAVGIDLLAYNSVLNVLASTGVQRYIDQAEDLLRFLEDSQDLVPDSYSFNTVLKAYASNNQCEKAEKLLQRWRRLFADGRARDMPDCHSFSVVISCWARTNAKESGRKAQQILEWMEENNVTPNLQVYNGVLNAWGRSGDPEAPLHLEAIWGRMPDHDSFSYICYVNSIFRTGNYDQMCHTEKLMRKASAKNLIEPDLRLCVSVISGYGHSREAGAIDRVHTFLGWMESIGLFPDIICFNAVFTAYKSLLPENRAGEAMEIYRNMSPEPSTVTYTLLVDICKDHDDFLIQLFQDCTRRGMLDGRLVESFIQYGPPLVVERLRGKDEIPRDWQRNASRGPSTPSRNMIKRMRANNKRGPGMQVDEWCW